MHKYTRVHDVHSAFCIFLLVLTLTHSIREFINIGSVLEGTDHFKE